MVGSSHASLFSAVSAGVGALWGPLHGGANCEVIKMLSLIHQEGIKPRAFVEKAKDKDSGVKLMGFGHRVYKSFDPRAKILKAQVDNVLKALNISDPLLDIAYELEEMARSEDYFIERNLYPNVDFYSGILLRALGIPVDMFTVLFAIGRMPGWIANWREMHVQSLRISRPRQIYTGETLRTYVPMEQR
jgi:citrate synthase